MAGGASEFPCRAPIFNASGQAPGRPRASRPLFAIPPLIPPTADRSGETPKAANHLNYLDGLRGGAALYVMLFHWQMHVLDQVGGAVGALPVGLRFALSCFGYGHAAVCVFIVLSGYVLMLPLARPGGVLRGGRRGFFKRRARRLLPTYYAALILFSGLLLLGQHLPESGSHLRRDFDWWAFIQHVFLVQNLSSTRWYAIDGPMWSLATEWQIYLVFIAVILPLYRRVGWLITLLLTGIVSLLPHYFLPADRNLDQAAPWFLALFVLGMGAALWSHPNLMPMEGEMRQTTLWGGIAAAFLLLFLLMVQPVLLPVSVRTVLLDHLWITDMVCGMAVAALLVCCTQTLQNSARSAFLPLLRVFQSRLLVAVGVFSYSLYLVHQPLIGLVVQGLHGKPFYLSGTMLCVVSLLFLPLIVALSYGFYRVFERPFTQHGRENKPFVLRALFWRRVN